MTMVRFFTTCEQVGHLEKVRTFSAIQMNVFEFVPFTIQD